MLAAWCGLWLWGDSANGHMLMHGAADATVAAGSPARFAVIVAGGWTLMTVAMMLPTSIPLALLFHRMVRGRRYAAWLVLVLVSGYVVTWAGGGLLLQFANAALQSGVARIVSPVAPPWLVAAVILTIAGLYQFTSLKYACLDKCRSPLMFLTTRWHGGNESLQAFRIGVEHGVFCVGCCWSLMLLLFLVGTSSLVWMLLLGVVMALEKNFPGAGE